MNNNTDGVDFYYTPKEVATILRVSTYVVYHLLTTEVLRGFRVNRQWRIPKASVQKFIDSSELKGD